MKYCSVVLIPLFMARIRTHQTRDTIQVYHATLSGLVVITTTQLFQFLGKEIGTP